MAKFVSHTSGTETVDGAKGKNGKMERGSSVSANPIWTPGGPQSPRTIYHTTNTQVTSHIFALGTIIEKSVVKQFRKSNDDVRKFVQTWVETHANDVQVEPSGEVA